MCGFVAMISKNGRPVSREQVNRMSEDIAHRGPDDAGEWFSDWCALGFRRLSIFDLSSHGHQPMMDQTGTFVIAYNGEVYNFPALRKDLEDEGVVFRSNSDTEVVLQAYIRWGSACLVHFLGMFAFVIVNVRTHEVFLARDQFGIKPLYFTESKDFWWFSSEIKSFRNAMKFQLNHDVLYEQMIFSRVAGTNTPFKDIYKLGAGTFWRLTPGLRPLVHTYANPTDSLNPQSATDEDSVLKQLHASLIESIDLHTRSDVGYSVQLSGGVDSSFVTAVLARDLGAKLETFSVTLEGSVRDESPYQRRVATTFGTHHHELAIGEHEFSEAFDDAIWRMDAPLVDLSCVMLMLLCRQSVGTSKVILTGEGADELFAGYSRYLRLGDEPWHPGGRVTSYLNAIGVKPHMLPNIGRLGQYKTQLQAKVTDLPRGLKRPAMESFLSNIPESIPYRDSIADSQSSGFLQVLALDQKCQLESMLDRQDKMSMAASVEARVPFCNPVLFNQVNPVPASLKIKGGLPKYLLKKIGEQYLDNELLYRRKQALVLPIDQWLRRGTLAQKMSILTDQTTRERGFYNNKQINAAISQFQRGEELPSRYLISLISFETWMRMFID
jgi:asparagine synthase (glutamine-hydrolysing)